MGISAPSEGAWLSSTRMAADDVESLSEGLRDDQPPIHPVPAMQGAFEESMMETLNDIDDSSPPDRYSTADSVSRRKILLEQEEYERTVAGRWKQKPGEKFHPLWKLVAQISFGMHLLQQALAKSDEEVIKILQTHVDEVDGFLERTTEDFDLAQEDINERIRYLRLPLEHGHVFDTMLNDRSFRTAIVEGNEKIEHIVDRTAAAMKDALKDVQKGLDATRELTKYLTRLDRQWDQRSDEHESVYLAMIGNTEGWSRAFQHLQHKGNTLGGALGQLGGIIAEMQRRAGIASRKNLVPMKPVQGKYYVERPSPSMSSRHSLSPPVTPNKPLPTAPDSMAQAVQSVTSQKHPNITHTRMSSRNSSQAQPKLHKNPSKKVVQVETISSVPQATAAKIPARKTSSSGKTRSLTRKLSFFKDQPENDSTHVVSSPNYSSSRKPRVQQSSSPNPDDLSTSTEAANKPLYPERQSPPVDSQNQVPPSGSHLYDCPSTASNRSVEAIPADPSTKLLQDPSPASVPSASPSDHFQGLAQETGDRTTILFVESHHNRQALSDSWTYPSKAVDTATVHTVRALPLRNYHSSETLQEGAYHPSSNQANVHFHPEQTTSFQNSPTEIHLPPTNSSSPQSSVSASPPHPSTASVSIIAAPPQTRQDSVSAPSDDGDTLRAVPITQVSPQSDQDTFLSPSTQSSAAQPPVLILRPTTDSRTTVPPSNSIGAYNGAASCAPLIDFLLSNPAPTPANRSYVHSAHSRGPSGHSTKSAAAGLHHRHHSGHDSRRPHIIHPSISHEDVKALGRREDGSHNQMVNRRPSGWKRVFTNGLGGHKKSKGENYQVEKMLGLKTGGIDPPRTTGAGKDGVWISRKNFLKT